MTVLLQILENLLFIGFIGVGFYAVERSRAFLGSVVTSMFHGLSLGVVAFLVTAVPVTLPDSATVDARAGPVMLAGVVGGPIGALITAVLGGLARSIVGGGFAVSGVIVYAVYAAFGLALRYSGLVDPRRLWNVRSVALLCGASFVGAAAMFFLIHPRERALMWLEQDLPLILLANALSIGLSVAVISIAMTYFAKINEVVEVNERLRLARTAGRFGIWDYDVVGNKLNWDERSKELHGFPSDTGDLTYEDWAARVHPDDFSSPNSAFEAAIERGSNEYITEYRVLLPGGGTRTIKGDAVVVRGPKGQAERIVGTNIDLTEIRRAEAELAEARAMATQAQKFDTIGQITGGVAHDFNNLLAVILGNLELLKDSLKAENRDVTEYQELIDASIEATMRGADLTQNMLAYARKAQLTPERIELNDVVRQTESWMRRTIESRVEIETVLQAGLWPISADRTSVQSSLVNLLLNARDALAGPGRVTIETANVRVDEDYVSERAEEITPGRYVMLAVSDNGPGIAPDRLEKIFDPFFTTKKVGEGSGLGLSMVQGFVKQSGGTIRVYSEAGVGTSFKLYFPADIVADRNTAPEKLIEETEAVHSADKLSILLVEDQPQVIKVLQAQLVKAGFDVTPAVSGDEAFEIFKQNRRFDLVVTDIVMPGRLQGPALAREIRKISPETPFIFMSGYASEATVHGNGLRHEDIRLMKPIARSTLLDAIAKVIASQSNGKPPKSPT